MKHSDFCAPPLGLFCSRECAAEWRAQTDGSADTVAVPRRWVEEAVGALAAATTIGMRSCRAGDHLHYDNHDRLIAEARPWIDPLHSDDAC
jgi:hypothetical protein